MFELLFQALKEDPSKYEIKIAILEGLSNRLNKYQVETFMNIIEGVLSMPADYNIFKSNLNPLRLGLFLYKMISDIS